MQRLNWNAELGILQPHPNIVNLAELLVELGEDEAALKRYEERFVMKDTTPPFRFEFKGFWPTKEQSA